MAALALCQEVRQLSFSTFELPQQEGPFRLKKQRANSPNPFSCRSPEFPHTGGQVTGCSTGMLGTHRIPLCKGSQTCCLGIREFVLKDVLPIPYMKFTDLLLLSFLLLYFFHEHFDNSSTSPLTGLLLL